MCKRCGSSFMTEMMSRVCAFLLGAWEFRGNVGMLYDGSTWSPRSKAYDWGRECAHRVTFRRFES